MHRKYVFWRFFYLTWTPPTWTTSFTCTTSTWWRKCILPTIIQIDGIVLQAQTHGRQPKFIAAGFISMTQAWWTCITEVGLTICVMWKLYIVGCVFVSMTWVEYLTNVWENRAEWSRKIFFSEVPVMHGSHICCVQFFPRHKGKMDASRK